MSRQRVIRRSIFLNWFRWLIFSSTFPLTVEAGTGVKMLKESPPKLESTRADDLRSIMHDFYQKIIELRPALQSLETFSTSQNQKIVLDDVHGFQDRLKQIQDDSALKDSGRSALVTLFQDHLHEVEKSLARRDLQRSYQSVRQTTEFCFACHTRLPQDQTPQLDWKQDLKAQDPNNALVTADFYFVTRRYEYSINIYDHLLRSYPNSVLKAEDLSEVYRRKLLVFARVWRAPQRAITNLNADLDNSQLPLNQRREIEVWIKSFGSWLKSEKKSGMGDKDSQWNQKKRVKFARQILKETESYRGPSGMQPFLVSLLRASGLLYEGLGKSSLATQDRAEILYYLGKVERVLSQSSFLLLSDLYLKECVHLAPATQWGPRCLVEYKTFLAWRYPQASSIPKDIQAELKELDQELAAVTTKTKKSK